MRILPLLFLIAVQAVAQDKQQTYCNPINLNYRFMPEDPVRREAADPCVITFKSEYYLFASKSGGYWSSGDLLNWNYIACTSLPIEDYAPAVVAIGDTLYFMASSREIKPIYKTADPKSGKWSIANNHFPFAVWDPSFFRDDNGRLYLHWGCSNKAPLYGIELDLKNNLAPIGKPTELLYGDILNHGWEQRGENNELNESPWIEGAWMNKHNGVYYFQYAAPGTEYKGYGDGVYTSRSPLGPFKYETYSPFSFKPGGFIRGAGHSTTFEDKNKNYWHLATQVISVRHIFERRLGLFPAGFDSDGELFCNTSFGDYPHYMNGDFTGWMLLSYNKKIETSTHIDSLPSINAVDENIKSYWSALTGYPGEWIMVDLEKASTIHAMQINFTEHQTKVFAMQEDLSIKYKVEYSNDKVNWLTLIDRSQNQQNNPHDYTQLATPVSARYVKITNVHMPFGAFAISDIRVFGNASGNVPEKVTNVLVKQGADKRKATMSWDSIVNADGYEISYGITPNKLNNSILVYGTNKYDITFLNLNTPYYFSVKAFNASGVGKQSAVFELK